jgi:hypothetical protein
VSTTVTLVSDTHVPQRAKALPAAVWEAVESADLVVHAGDWNGLPLLDEFERRAKCLLAVRGNNDGPEFDDRLPLVSNETVDGVRLAVVHQTGDRKGREERADHDHPDAELILFGHSHIPWDTVTPEGRRMLNPGSPTDRRRQPNRTFVTLTLDRGEVRDVILHHLPLD